MNVQLEFLALARVIHSPEIILGHMHQLKCGEVSDITGFWEVESLTGFSWFGLTLGHSL